MKRLLLFVLCGLPLVAQDPVREWIVKSAVRLETPQAGHGFADMAGIRKIVGNARIVSLGEATHGTREFFQLKHRMLEYLATEMGFTIFSIEANMPEAYRLNDYVLNGKGDPAQLLRGMYFWTWDTEEVLDMIQWMRAFNKSGKGRVEFTGFDMQTPTVALLIVRDFVGPRDEEYAASEAYKKAVTMAMASPRSNAFGVATATLPVEAARGRKAKLSGWIKTEAVTRGYAGLWFRVDGPEDPLKPPTLAFDNMAGRGATGTTDWKQYVIELPVAAQARNINFGALFPGDGTAWFDGLTIELDGKPYQSDTMDLDFESSPVKGFYTGGQGYRVHPDTAVVHSGKQSLRMSHLADSADAVAPKEASAAWQAVVSHMEQSRAAYAKSGASAEAVEWAIQNARVVLQCMQMRANEVPRDRSMADNIQWILDRNPKAKIVLWAHNGHVAASGIRGYEPMGADLRRKYGDRMVVFGFAFHRGSFQAIGMGGSGGGLRDWTVAAAPEGTLDAKLASAGIPVFALDLRNAPAWFNESHRTRMIGSGYSEESAQNYWNDMVVTKAYDALLFVDNTAAARKNPR